MTASGRWDLEADVVVAGAGATGLTAALTAAEGGTSVILVEANTDVGGRALLSGGAVDIGGGTRMQRALGLEDSAEQVFRDLTNHRSPAAKKNDPAAMRRYADHSARAMAWLEAHGVRFVDVAEVPPIPGVDPGRYHIVAWDEEGTDRSPGRLYTRGPAGPHSGAGLVRPLEDAVRRAGVPVLLNHALTGLERDAEGRVTGVRTAGETQRIGARHGVVLGTGGLNGNVQLRRIFDPRLTEEYQATGEPWVHAVGAGILAAQELGAQLAPDYGLDGHWLMPRVPTHTTTHSGIWGGPIGCRYAALHMHAPHPGGLIATRQGAQGLDVHDLSNLILVKHDGRRFYDEETYDEIGFCDAALAEGGGPVWAVFDADGAAREGWRELSPPVVEEGYFFTADSLTELAELTQWRGAGMPPDALTATVDRYNRMVDAGTDADFGRAHPTRRIERPPFHAAWATPVLHNPRAGLRVDEHCRVLDIHGRPIAGLYAGGEAVGGSSRIGTAKAILTGRIAVAHLLGELSSR